MLSSCLAVFFGLARPLCAAELLVAAAADVAPLEQQLRDGFQKAADKPVQFVFGSSGMLARQIENGAPYDVYLSANEQFVHDLAAQGKLLPGSVRVYALGRIALWSKKGHDINSARRIAIANPVHAPYGVAARQYLEKEGLWRKVEHRVVYAENVRQALQYAESGNADAAITAWSLVFDRGGVLIPAELHAPIRQAGGVIAATRDRAGALAFLDFLTGRDGKALLKRWGLFPPN